MGISLFYFFLNIVKEDIESQLQIKEIYQI